MDRIDIGKRLKNERVKRELTLKTVGKKLNLDPSTVSKYEKGTRKIQLEMIQAFAEYYEIDVDALLNNDIKSAKGEKLFYLNDPLYPSYQSVTLGIFLVTWIFLQGMAWQLHPALTALGPIFIVVFCCKVLFDHLVHKHRAQKIVNLQSHEKLFLVHPSDLKSFIKHKSIDIITYFFLMFISTIITSFLIYDAPYDQSIFIIGLFMVNISLYITLISMVILGKTESLKADITTFNRLMNTMKYKIFSIITITTGFGYYFVFGIHRTVYPLDVQWVLFLLMTLYIMVAATQSLRKYQFHSNYKLKKLV